MKSDAPVTRLIHAGVLVSKQPPVVGDYCRVPYSGCEDRACGYEAATCRGDSQKCPRCRYRYCEQHTPTHKRAFQFPPDSWKSVRKQYREQLDAIAGGGSRKKRGRKRLRIKVPDLRKEFESA